MPEVDERRPGTPSWADVASPDVPAAAAFYAGLFGWEHWDAGPEGGGYGMFALDGKVVAGLGPQMNPGPPTWNVYVTVDDADATVAAARDAGATVFLEPMDVLDVGRMAIFADPTGAAVSIWQPRAHKGAQVVGEPGSLCWAELNTREPERAAEFYATVFGWEAKTHPGYTEYAVGGTSVAGMVDMRGKVPDEVPAHWLPYFAVADADATVASAKEAGATVFVGPLDIHPGRFAVLGDPHGAVFAVIRLAGQAFA